MKEDYGINLEMRCKAFARSCILIFLCLIACFFSVPVKNAMAGGKVKVNTIGSAPLIADNPAGSREKAIIEGLKKAVEFALVKILPAASLADNLDKAVSLISGNPEDYVENFRVVAEEQKDGSYHVLIEAAILTDIIGHVFMGDPEGGGASALPKVMVVAYKPDLEAAASIIRSKLLEKGIQIMERAGEDKDGPGMEGGSESTGVQPLGADFIVAVKSSTLSAPNLIRGHSKAYEAEVVLDIRDGTGISKIGSIRGTAIKTGTEEEAKRGATTAAAGNAGDRAVKMILSSWYRKRGAAELSLVITGTKHLGHFVRLKRRIEELPKIEEVLTEEILSNETRLKVKGRMTAKELAERLLLERFEGFGIEIYEIGETFIKLNIVSNR